MVVSIPRFTNSDDINVNENAKKFFQKIVKRRKTKLTDHQIKVSHSDERESEAIKDLALPTEDNTNDNIEDPIDADEAKSKKSKTDLFVLGGHQFDKINKVNRVLPNWLKHPTVISTDLSDLKITPKDFELNPRLTNILEKNIKYFLPVQAEVIPWLLKYWKSIHPNRSKPARDLCVSAPTGSGKTLAYVVPIVQSLEKRLIPEIRAIIIVPVQELAIQVGKVLDEYIHGTNLKVVVTTGGNSSLIDDQRNLVKPLTGTKGAFQCQADILVTTPGRLVKHIEETKGFNLTHLKYLVIDEADRVIDSMQNNWLYHLQRHIECQDSGPVNFLNLHCLNRKITTPQKLLFSATLSQDPEKLKQLNLFQPKLFTSVVPSTNTAGEVIEGNPGEFIGKFTTPAELTEYYVSVSEPLKPLAICQFLERGWKKILCFAKSCENAHRLAKLLSILNKGMNIRELSSALARNVRDEALSSFESGNTDVLVCSDLVARGLDIPGVQYVISYEPPKFIKGYIHRAGRTGRAGQSGTAVTLVTAAQETMFLQQLKAVNKLNVNKMDIDEDTFRDKAVEYKKALEQLKVNTKEEKKTQLRKFKNMKTVKRPRKRKQNK